MMGKNWTDLFSWRGLQGVILVLSLLVSIFILAHRNSQLKDDIVRMAHNQRTILSDVEYYKSRAGEQVATIEALTLQRDELQNMLPEYETEISNLRIKLRKVESIGRVASETNFVISAPLEDYVHKDIVNERVENVADSLREYYSSISQVKHFHWADQYNRIDGVIDGDSVHCALSIKDSLTLVAYKKKRRCLFKRKGKIIGYTVISKNPNTHISDIEYVEIVK